MKQLSKMQLMEQKKHLLSEVSIVFITNSYKGREYQLFKSHNIRDKHAKSQLCDALDRQVIERKKREQIEQDFDRVN